MAIQLEPVIAKEHFEYQITCIDSHTQGSAAAGGQWNSSSVRQRYDREKESIFRIIMILSEQR